jgi:hypothetical protein
MKKAFLSFCAILVFMVGCDTQKKDTGSKVESSVKKSPFSLSVVPETSQVEPFGSNIAMAHDKPQLLRRFYERFGRAAGCVGILE